MCIPQNIIERLVCGAFDEAVKAGKYVLQYRTNLDKLRTEMRSLEDRRAIIERKVHEAVDHGKEIEIAVLHWQADTDKVKNYVQDLIEQSTAEAKMHCFACSCPNIKWRYRLGKQAEEKIADVKTLAQESHFDEISHPEPPPPPELEFPSAENYVHLDSRTPIFEAILGALNDPKVEMIGVYGRGGVGKTTLVKKVAKKMLDDGTFKQVLLVVVSKDLHVKEIQKKLADGLNFALDAKDEKGRANELCHKFKNGEKYLVILDDIWEKVDLKAIGIPVMEGNIGCKVVLTSRKEDLLRITMKADRNFPIGELPEEEGWILFKKKLGNTIESWPEINSLAREVCRKCNGLPVAINALGAALEDRPYHAWKNALDKLDRHMLTQIEGIDPSVLASLSVSFDMLHSSDAQSCFLLCCLFAEDVEILIDELTRHCMARSLLTQNPRTFDEARTAMCIVVDVLKSASLLSTSDHETIVKIPDVIRDIGISIAREKEAFLVDHSALRWPRNPTNGPSYKAISLNFKSIKGLPDGLVYPQLETLMVDHGELSDLEVPDNFFNGMIHLKVLTFTRMTLRQLPSSLAKLANLRMLHLNHCELVDLAILRDLKTNLEVLGLRSSTIKALPQEIRELTNLRVLDLIDCDDLKVIPQGVISNLTSLEELYFPSTFKEWEVTSDKKQETSNSNNVSLEELRWLLSTGQLTTLHIHIPDVMLLPKDILMFQNLKRFRISSSNFKINENFQRRKVVDKADHVLYLSGVKGLENILHDNEDGNVSLEFDYHPNEQSSILQSHEMHWLNSFNRLIVLHISNCKTKYLFSQSTARGLVHLEELVVQSCERMEEIVGFEGQNDEEELTSELKFRKLKRLVLQFLPNFISFYSKKEKVETTMGSSSASAQPLFNEKVILPVLEVLEVDRLGNIVEIWDKQSLWLNERMHIVSFGKLRDVKVQRCEKLMKLVPSNILPRLDELQKLCVEGCPKIESVVFENEEEAADDRTLIIPQLQYLRISEMELLKSFYSSFTASNAQSLFNHQVILPVLEVLEVDRLGNIVEIWDKQSPWLNERTLSFSKLRDVKVQRCETLMKLVPSNILQRLDKLQKLCVEGCPKIESVVFKDKNEEVADDRTLMPQLWYLRISDMENLKSFYSSSTASNAQSLFNHQVAFPLLENFELEGCASLRYSFHPYMGDLVNLREIIIKHCPEMRAVISTENDKEEEVEDRQQRETKTTMFPNLSKLELHHLQELKLFCHYTRPLEFPLLRQMAICYCPSMDSFSLGHVRALDLSLKGISHKIGKIDSDDTTVTAQKNQEDEEPKNGGKKIFGRISIEEA